MLIVVQGRKASAVGTVPIHVESRKVDTGEMMVIVTGEVDLASTPWVTKEIGRHSGRVVVDLRRVDFMDSTGLRALITQHERLEASGGHLRLLIKTDQHLRRLLDISGLTGVFDVSDSLHPLGAEEPPATAGTA